MPRKPLNTLKTDPMGISLNKYLDVRTKYYMKQDRFPDMDEITMEYNIMTPEQLQLVYTQMLDADTALWEYAANENLPTWVRNTGDTELLNQYLDENSAALSFEEEYLIERHIQSEQKRQGIEAAADTAMAAGDPPLKSADVKIEARPDGDEAIELLDVHQRSKQTSENGCWSCFYQILASSKGLQNVTQEDIRSYRPKLNMEQGENADVMADEAYNTDGMNNAMDMGDSILSYVPGHMLLELEIPKFGEDMAKEITGEAYLNGAVEQIKKTLKHSLKDLKSPVGVLQDRHYITIVGIDGDMIKFKNSAGEDPDPDHTYTESLSDFVKRGLTTGEYPAMQFTYMSEIQLSKDGKTIFGVPSDYSLMNPDGSVTEQPGPIKEGSGVWSMQALNKKGQVVARYAGREDTKGEQLNRSLLTDNVVKTEKVYIPRKLNAEYLKKQAGKRTAAEERRLRRMDNAYYNMARPLNYSLDDSNVAGRGKRPVLDPEGQVNADNAIDDMNVRNRERRAGIDLEAQMANAAGREHRQSVIETSRQNAIRQGFENMKNAGLEGAGLQKLAGPGFNPISLTYGELLAVRNYMGSAIGTDSEGIDLCEFNSALEKFEYTDAATGKRVNVWDETERLLRNTADYNGAERIPDGVMRLYVRALILNKMTDSSAALSYENGEHSVRDIYVPTDVRVAEALPRQAQNVQEPAGPGQNVSRFSVQHTDSLALEAGSAVPAENVPEAREPLSFRNVTVWKAPQREEPFVNKYLKEQDDRRKNEIRQSETVAETKKDFLQKVLNYRDEAERVRRQLELTDINNRRDPALFREFLAALDAVCALGPENDENDIVIAVRQLNEKTNVYLSDELDAANLRNHEQRKNFISSLQGKGGEIWDGYPENIAPAAQKKPYIDAYKEQKAKALDLKTDEERLTDSRLAHQYYNEMNRVVTAAGAFRERMQGLKKAVGSDSAQYAAMSGALDKVCGLNVESSILEVRAALSELNNAAGVYRNKIELTGGAGHTNGQNRLNISDEIKALAAGSLFLNTPLPAIDITRPIGALALQSVRDSEAERRRAGERFTPARMRIIPKEQEARRITKTMDSGSFKIKAESMGWVMRPESNYLEQFFDIVDKAGDPDLDKVLESMTQENSWDPGDHYFNCIKLKDSLRKLGYTELEKEVKKHLVDTASRKDITENAELAGEQDIYLARGIAAPVPRFINQRDRMMPGFLDDWENIDNAGEPVRAPGPQPAKISFKGSRDGNGKKYFWDDESAALYYHFTRETANAALLMSRGRVDEGTIRLYKSVSGNIQEFDDSWHNAERAVISVPGLGEFVKNYLDNPEAVSDAREVLRSISRTWKELSENTQADNETNRLLKRYYEDNALFTDPDAGNYSRAVALNPHLMGFISLQGTGPALNNPNLNLDETIAGLRGQSPKQNGLPEEYRRDIFKDFMDLMHAGADELRAEYLRQELLSQGAWNEDKEKAYSEALISAHKSVIDSFGRLLEVPDAGQYDEFLENALDHTLGRKVTNKRDIYIKAGILKGELKALENGWGTEEKTVLGIIGGLEARLEKQRNEQENSLAAQADRDLLLLAEKDFAELKNFVWDKKVTTPEDKRQVINRLTDFMKLYENRAEYAEFNDLYGFYSEEVSKAASRYPALKEEAAKEREERENALSVRRMNRQNEMKELTDLHRKAVSDENREYEAFCARLEGMGWHSRYDESVKEIAKMRRALKASLRNDADRERLLGIKTDEVTAQRKRELLSLTESICAEVMNTTVHSKDGCLAYMDMMIQKLAPFNGVVYGAGPAIEYISKLKNASLGRADEEFHEEMKKAIPDISVKSVSELSGQLENAYNSGIGSEDDRKGLKELSDEIKGLLADNSKNVVLMDPEIYDRIMIIAKGAKELTGNMKNDPAFAENKAAALAAEGIERLTNELAAPRPLNKDAAALARELMNAAEQERTAMTEELIRPDHLTIKGGKLIKSYSSDKLKLLTKVYKELGETQMRNARLVTENAPETADQAKADMRKAASVQAFLSGKLKGRGVMIKGADADSFIRDIQMTTYEEFRNSVARELAEGKPENAEDAVRRTEELINGGIRSLPEADKNLYNFLARPHSQVLRKLGNAIRIKNTNIIYENRLNEAVTMAKGHLKALKDWGINEKKDSGYFTNMKNALIEVAKLDTSKTPAQIVQAFENLRTASNAYFNEYQTAFRSFKSEKGLFRLDTSEELVNLSIASAESLDLARAHALADIKAGETLKDQMDSAEKGLQTAQEERRQREISVQDLSNKLKNENTNRKVNDIRKNLRDKTALKNNEAKEAPDLSKGKFKL